jgi:hypothetical protein
MAFLPGSGPASHILRDELRLIVFPFPIGGGLRIFGGGLRIFDDNRELKKFGLIYSRVVDGEMAGVENLTISGLR